MASRAPATPPRKPSTIQRKPSQPIITSPVPEPQGGITQSGESADWISSIVDYTLTDDPTKRGLSLVGAGNLTGIGNDGGTSMQNTLSAASNTGNATLIAGSASTTMIGGSGNNWLDATSSQGTVSLRGGSGSSTMYASNGQATLVGGSQNNLLFAGASPTRSVGQSLVGGTSTSSLQGNTLNGGAGRDTLRSGAGFSTLISGSVTATSSLTATADEGSTSITLADISGFAVGQTLSGIGVAAGTRVTAVSGSTLTLSAALTAAISGGTAVSGFGANTLLGGGVSNLLLAGGGNDSLSAISGSSTLYGGAGKTTLVSGSGTNWLQSGSSDVGGNTLLGANGKSNTLVAGAGSMDLLVGSSGTTARNSSNSFLFTQNNLGSQRIVTDALSANYGINNSLLLGFDGQTVSDSTFAGAWVSKMGRIQITTLVGAEGNLISLGANAQKAGIRTLIGGSGNDTLSVAGYSSLGGALLDARASQQNTTLIGGAGNDTFYGTEDGSDSIAGGGGNNSIYYSKQDFGYSTVNGGSSSGKNNLIMSGQGVTLQGEGFNNVSNISSLSLSGGLNVISDLQGSGIKKITGGSGSESLSAQIRATTTAVGTRGSFSLLVDSTGGLAVGQKVSGSGIAQGTTIAAISGNVLTLSDTLTSNSSRGSTILAAIDRATLDGSRSFTDSSYTDFTKFNLNFDAVAGSTSLWVGYEVSQLKVGMTISGPGIADGTTITDIWKNQGPWITLSKPTTGVAKSGAQNYYGSFGLTGEYLQAEGKNVLLVGSTLAGSDAVLSSVYEKTPGAVPANTLVAGAYAGNTLIGGAFDNTFVLNTQTSVGGQSNSLGTISTALHLGLDSLGRLSSNPNKQGIGTLILANDGATLTDSAFSKVSRNALQIFQSGDGANSFSLGARAANAGIQKILLGSGNDTLSLATPQQYRAATIDGGSGTNLLAVGSGAKLNDSFTNISNIQAISLSGAGAGATLGTNARYEGITTLYGGDGGATLAQLEAPNFTETLAGTAGEYTLYAASNRALAVGETLSGVGVPAGTTITAISPFIRTVLPYRDSIGNNPPGYLVTLSSALNGSWPSTQVSTSRTVNNQYYSSSYTGTTGSTTLTLQNAKGFHVGQTVIGGVNNLTPTTITAISGNSVTLSSALTENNFYLSTQSTDTNAVGTAGNNTLNLLSTDGFYVGDTLSNWRDAFGNRLTIEAMNGNDLTLSGALDSWWGGNQSANLITAQYTTPYAAALIGGNGNDFISVATEAEYLVDTIAGGNGKDTLTVGQSLALNDSLQSNVSGIEVLKLSDSSALTLGAGLRDGANKISMVIGGGSGDTLTQTADYTSGLTLSGIGGANLYNLASSSYLTTDSIAGGSGLDTLALGTAATLNDAFTRLSSIEVLSLSGASGVTLGAAAMTVGISTVVGGSGNNTLVQTSADTLSLYLSGGGGNDSISVATGAQLTSNTISGGSGTDTLVVGTASSLNVDSSNVSGIEFLSLSGNSSLTLGSGSKSADVATVIAGSGNDFFTISDQNVYATKTISGGSGTDTLSLGGVYSTLADTDFSRISGIEVLSLSSSSLFGSSVTLGSSALAAGIRTLAGGSGNDTLLQTAADTLSLSLSGGEGNDSISVATAAQFLADSISGGAGRDTLSIGAPIMLGDASFSKISDIEVLQIASSSSVTLGSFAQQKGITSVVLGNGSDTVNASTYTRSITLDATANTGANSNLLIGSSTAGTNFLFSSVTAFAAGSLRGGSANDTLTFSQSAAISDFDLAQASGVQVLSLSGSSSVVLGAAAKANNLITVIGGSGNDTFVQTTADTLSTTLVGGEGNDSFLLYTSAIFAADSIAGGTGIDTITINSSATLNDAFSRLSGIEVLSLSGPSSVTLGSAAQSAGLQSLFGGSGNDSFTTTVGLRFINAGNGNNTLTGSSYGFDTLIGGTGNDSITGNGTAVSLSGGAGINVIESRGNGSTLVGGSGSDTLSVLGSAYDNLVIAGSGNALISFGSETSFTSASLTGSSGNHTLQFTGAVTLNDEFYNVQNGITPSLSLFGTSSVVLGYSGESAGIYSVTAGNGNDTIDASAYNSSVSLDAGGGNNSLIGGNAADSITSGSGNDTLRGWGTTGNITSDTLTGGTGADLFVLGDASSNAYGNSGGKALISDFTGGQLDYLQLKNYGLGALSYRVDANAASGYTHQLFDISGGGSGILLANINYSGTDASGDLLGSKAIFV